MLEVIVCDNKKEKVLEIEQMISSIKVNEQLEIEQILATTNPEEIAEFARTHSSSFDRVYILGIELNNSLNGLDTARLIRKTDRCSYIVFLTDNKNHMKQSFQAKPFDFILKPITKHQLSILLKDILIDIAMIKQEEQEPSLKLKNGTQTHSINVSKIIYIDQQQNKQNIFLQKGVVPCNFDLNYLEQQLFAHGFFRCHSSYIVNIRHVKDLKKQSNTIIMTNGARIPVARLYRKKIWGILKK